MVVCVLSPVCVFFGDFFFYSFSFFFLFSFLYFSVEVCLMEGVIVINLLIFKVLKGCLIRKTISSIWFKVYLHAGLIFFFFFFLTSSFSLSNRGSTGAIEDAKITN